MSSEPSDYIRGKIISFEGWQRILSGHGDCFEWWMVYVFMVLTYSSHPLTSPAFNAT